MRRSQVAILTSLVSVLSLLIGLCPCPMAVPALESRTAAHDCCVAEVGIQALAPSCCDVHAGQASSLVAVAPASITATSISAVAVELAPIPAVPSEPRTALARAAAIPPVLRI